MNCRSSTTIRTRIRRYKSTARRYAEKRPIATKRIYLQECAREKHPSPQRDQSAIEIGIIIGTSLPKRVDMQGLRSIAMFLATLGIPGALAISCYREIRSMATEVSIPMAGCRQDRPAADIRDNRLYLTGSTDPITARLIRSAAKKIWWVSTVDDNLRTDCVDCQSLIKTTQSGFGVLFATGLADLDSQARRSVRDLGDVLRCCPVQVITFSGWSDFRWINRPNHPANSDYNTSLSQRRADAVKVELQRLLAPSTAKPAALGRGVTQDFTQGGPPDSLEGLAPNRRVTVELKPAEEHRNMQTLFLPAWFLPMFWMCWTAALISGGFTTFTLLKYWGWNRATSAPVLGPTPEPPDSNPDSRGNESTTTDEGEEPRPTPRPGENVLEIIEGIGPYFAAQIEAVCNIRTIPELAAIDTVNILRIAALRPRSTAKGAQLPELGLERAREWVAMAKLIQLPTVTKDWAELFVAAGIRSIEELAREDKHQLLLKIRDANRKSRNPEHVLARYEPSKLELGYIIKLAQDASQPPPLESA